jgi:hypothetical protein
VIVCGVGVAAGAQAAASNAIASHSDPRALRFIDLLLAVVGIVGGVL